MNKNFDIKLSYKEMTMRILANFQLIEFSLKLYIGCAYSIINSNVSGKVHFDYSIKDVENHSLERLLNIFCKLNENKDLHKKLNKLRNDRNHIAHEALLYSLGTDCNFEVLHEKHRDFFYLEDVLSEVLDQIKKELQILNSKKNNDLDKI